MKDVRAAGDAPAEDMSASAEDLAAMGVESGSEALARGDKPRPGMPAKRPPNARPQLSEEEQAAMEEMQGSAAKEVPFELPDESEEWPEWVVVPTGLKVEPGTLVAALLFEADTCKNPAAGDFHCLVWPLKDKEQALAYKRTNGVTERALSELAKGAVRGWNGTRVSWPGGTGQPGDVDVFWEGIGPKGRSMLVEWYLNTHAFTKEERVRFFGRCIATKRAG